MAQPAMNWLKAAQYLLDTRAVSYNGQNTGTERKKTGSHSKIQQVLRGERATDLTSEHYNVLPVTQFLQCKKKKRHILQHNKLNSDNVRMTM
jgi:hypothetical protein